jgi:hypothetical protein
LIIGGLPGFIWGWFHVPDETMIITAGKFLSVYQMPMLGMAVTLVIYQLLLLFIQPKFQPTLINILAASGVSCYYWYRVPSLLGFGNWGKDGLLVNCTGILAGWMVIGMTIATTLLFFYWLVFRKNRNKSWIVRPQFGSKQETKLAEPLL